MMVIVLTHICITRPQWVKVVLKLSHESLTNTHLGYNINSYKICNSVVKYIIFPIRKILCDIYSEHFWAHKVRWGPLILTTHTQTHEQPSLPICLGYLVKILQKYICQDLWKIKAYDYQVPMIYSLWTNIFMDCKQNSFIQYFFFVIPPNIICILMWLIPIHYIRVNVIRGLIQYKDVFLPV